MRVRVRVGVCAALRLLLQRAAEEVREVGRPGGGLREARRRVARDAEERLQHGAHLPQRGLHLRELDRRDAERPGEG